MSKPEIKYECEVCQGQCSTPEDTRCNAHGSYVRCGSLGHNTHKGAPCSRWVPRAEGGCYQHKAELVGASR